MEKIECKENRKSSEPGSAREWRRDNAEIHESYTGEI
jgi:hypothetical protein